MTAAARRTALLVAAAVLLPACGSSEDDDTIVRAASSSTTTTTVATTTNRDPRPTIQELEVFSTELSETPAWASVDRFGPAPLAALLEGVVGVVVGTVVRLEEGPADEFPAGELFDPAPDPGIAEGLAPGTEVGVPVAIWLSGSTGLAPAFLDREVTRIVENLASWAPVGGRAAVLVTAVEPTATGVVQAATPFPGGTTTPSAVVFEAVDGTLFGLDWLVGDIAPSYYGVSTLDELLELAP